MGNKVTKGQKVGKYMILSELGRGAFGVVHKARKDSGLIYAVKSLLNSADEQVSQKELEMAEHISKHDNIVSIHEYFTKPTDSGQEIFIVMEFCEGGDLDSYIVENKPELMERIEFMVDMARGVNYLHSIKVCHRDLKPQNVLLTKIGDRFVCKITDFGISKLQIADSMFATQCGSIPFVAPEIVDGAKYTFSVDVFSLGLLFFATATMNVVKVGPKYSLLPATIDSKGNLELLNTQIRNRKMSLKNFLKLFTKCVDLGEVIYPMLNVESEKRPGIDLVIAQVAEVKGILKAGAASSPRTSRQPPVAQEEPTDRVGQLQKQNEKLMKELMNQHHRAVSQSTLNSRMGDDTDFGSFEDDAVEGVIKVRRGIYNPGAGFSPENMGSFETDAVEGVIQVIDGRSNDSGIVVN